jgi:hypothetical protein
MDLSERFHEILYSWYPEVAAQKLKVSPLLISPHEVPVPTKIRSQIYQLLGAFHRVAKSSLYQQELKANLRCLPEWDPGNIGVLSSFDCHIDSQGDARLIEINTNAAFGLLGEVLYAAHDKSLGLNREMTALLKASFLNETKLFYRPLKIQKVAIIDQKPEGQNFYLEFLMFKQLFKDLGWETIIDDVGAFGYNASLNCLRHLPSNTIIDLVYNRYTDFYFQNPESQELQQAYCHGGALFSPHPRQYWLYGDKSRLSQLSRLEGLESYSLSTPDRELFQKTIPRTWTRKDFTSKEDLWQRRKAYFLKPMTSHGSKAVYRGASIARKILDQVWDSDFVAQEFIPPSTFHPLGGDTPFKVDLRFITYGEDIQLSLARLYRGQLTNFKSPGGGVAILNLQD